jgi:hypothetical protein
MIAPRRLTRVRCGPPVALALLVWLGTSGCSLRQPTLAHWHEIAFGMGGVGRALTGSEYSDAPRFGTDAAMLGRAGYALCLDKGVSHVCVDVPIDVVPRTRTLSVNPSAPGSYSTIVVTPGLRIGSNELPLGFLPINFIAAGVGGVHHASSPCALDGATIVRERASSLAVRLEVGLNVTVGERLGLRAGVIGVEGDLDGWLRRLSVLPEGDTPGGGAAGGYGAFHVRW